MMIGLGMLAGKAVFGKIISERASKAIMIVGLVLLVLAVLGVAKCSYDRKLIRNHEAEQRAETAKADRKADNNAAVQRRADDARVVDEATQLGKVQANATTDADRRLARHRCLRLQQQARRDGKPSPVC
jgi:hypothetical protein